MVSLRISHFTTLFTLLLVLLAYQVSAQDAPSTADATTTDAAPAPTSTDAPAASSDSASTVSPSTTVAGTGSSSTTRLPVTSAPTSTSTSPPDVMLTVPQLSVKKIELDVDDLTADINLNANVAQLVSINAGVQLSVQKINITIADVSAELELVVRLGHLVDIVQRVFDSVDLNPLLIGLINNVTSLVGTVVGAVDGLLGSITQGGKTLNFLIDNLGNIVQEVVEGAGGAVSSIVGNYLQNMTYTGASKQLDGGLTQKTYLYDELNQLVNIIFNAAGQVVQATVVKNGTNGGGSGGTTSKSSTTSLATATLPPVTTTTGA